VTAAHVGTTGLAIAPGRALVEADHFILFTKGDGLYSRRW
jgi:hypothetical protein